MAVDVKDLLERIGRDFDAYKEENDKRMAAFEKTGHESAEANARLDKLFDSITSAQTKIADIETIMARPRMADTAPGTIKAYAMAHDLTGKRVLYDAPVAARDAAELKWWAELRNENPPTSTQKFRAALQADSDVEGGTLIRPEHFVAQLIKAVDDQVFIRQLATVIPVTDSSALGVPTLDTDASDADWTAELAVGSEETALRLGKRSLTPHPLAKYVKISRTLLRLAALDPAAIVTSRLAYKNGIAQEKAFMTGTGNGQPLGLFTASNDGIPTGQDVSTGNDTTSPTFDGLIEAKYSIKAAYWPRARWLFHRSGVKLIAKLTDGDGQYLWQPATQVGQPDMILGNPLVVSDYVPSTFTTGQYVGMFADFSNYWIADSLSMEMQRLVELYAATNQVGFILRSELDGMPVLSEAFARVKLG